MRRTGRLGLAAVVVGLFTVLSAGPATAGPYSHPRWWAKYQALLNHSASLSITSPLSVGSNVDASQEDGPQSETSITIDPSNPSRVVGGSNEIFRLPMRAYFSTDGGKHFGADDLPLPPPATTNGTDFGSDPGVAFDTRGNVYYSYIVVFFNRTFGSIQGTELAVAKSFDGGQTWPQVTYFNFNSGGGKFNDKPMIAVDTNPSSPHHDSVYVAWDTTGGQQGKSSTNGALLFARSTDGGKTFSAPVAVNGLTGGPNGEIGADPFVGPSGEVYVAWHDVQNSAIMVNRSLDGGTTFGQPVTIAPTTIAFDSAIPPEASRGALLYPSCGADRSTDAYRGRLYCSWMDATPFNGTDIFVSQSGDGGRSWSAQRRVNDDHAGMVRDQFNQWLAVDPVTGAVDLSWSDPRNDPGDTRTDTYATTSGNGGTSFATNVKVTSVPSDESAANPFADAGNQYGDYEGIAAFGGVARPIWTDGRFDGTLDQGTGQYLGEEVFTAAVSVR
ncbi:MAG TPA: sialidase family protein [Solirubrobacteraceae bacterium]